MTSVGLFNSVKICARKSDSSGAKDILSFLNADVYFNSRSSERSENCETRSGDFTAILRTPSYHSRGQRIESSYVKPMTTQKSQKSRKSLCSRGLTGAERKGIRRIRAAMIGISTPKLPALLEAVDQVNLLLFSYKFAPPLIIKYIHSIKQILIFKIDQLVSIKT